MEAYLKRYMWTLKLALLAFVAYSGSGVLNVHILSMTRGLLDSFVPAGATELKRRPLIVTPRPAWSTSIRERNLFNARPPSPAEEAAQQATDHERAEEIKRGPPTPYEPCEESGLSVTLKLTMVAEPPAQSYAMIQLNGEDRMISEGEAFSDFKVASIQWTGEGGRVVLNEGGSYRCLALGKRGRGRPNPHRPPARVKRSEVKSSRANPYSEWIKLVAPGRYEVERAKLNEQLANLDSLINQARVIPHYIQGKPAGFKVVGVRANSIFRSLGLKSGDVLKSVGGEELTSINKALGLFEKLKGSDEVSLGLERLGGAQNLTFTMIDPG